MKRIAIVALLSIFTVTAVSMKPALADEDAAVGRNLHLGFGYKLWLSNWQTFFSHGPTVSGANLSSLAASAPASIPNISVRYRDFLLAASYLTTGNYAFGSQTYQAKYQCCAQTLEVDTWQATRQEEDVNLGYYVHKNVLLSVGYKGVTQKYTLFTHTPGVTFCGGPIDCQSSSKTTYSMATFGIAGSAPVGSGFSLYGNGVGGFGTVTYSPFSGNASPHDTAVYEASELGVAWKGQGVPLALSLGYKFQLLQTRINPNNVNNAGYSGYEQRSLDMTRGYMLGMTFIF